ncbi:triosephosphate isomerase [Metamycoplasma arthritidis]|uniref:Triosephosphate isomerase n=1 Tax=Metamycoplasma arthritidis (strain 158L3-1) TaxID=243272 RepID=B3PML0_META1|nr:triose-phosphate isomerase family protein [Metamycoplasma arthritidis]ACF07262.1 triosephosphate isomerase [Metamycoplasma arthritidis 158L3-1]VEU78785.1 triosephosphate isomerase [Metamycoplasma arthritidis]
MKYLLGNLKMNFTYQECEKYLDTLEKALSEANLKNVILGVAPSAEAMSLILKFKDRHFLFGTQNIFYKDKGAYTGEVSIRSAKEFGLDFTLTGHSERRHTFGETNDLINKKIMAINQTTIQPILCIGENLEEFNQKRTKDVLTEQITSALKNVDSNLDNLIISYEPVYSIGNGQVPENNYIEQVVSLIKKITNNKYKVLYGGSVAPKNIEELNKIKNLDGYLVGSAALDAVAFVKMAQTMDKQ